MESTIQNNTVVTLKLTEDEAKWLNAYMQNRHSEHEELIDRQMRENFFKATDVRNFLRVKASTETK